MNLWEHPRLVARSGRSSVYGLGEHPPERTAGTAVDEATEDIRKLAADGAGLLAMIEALRDNEGFTLTPLRLLLAFDKAFGIPWTEARDLLVLLDPDLRPIGPAGEVEKLFTALLRRS